MRNTVTFVTPRMPPAAGKRVVAITQIALFDAINSIERRYQPDLSQLLAAATASKEAAYLGLLDDAAPLFREGSSVPVSASWLLCRVWSRADCFGSAAKLYGEIGPAFYGLRTTLLTLLLVALLVNMDVVLMRAIRARPQHRRELGTSALPQAFAKVLGHVRVREFHHLSVGKPKRMDIECIGLAVLGELRADTPVTAAAIKRGEIIDGLE
jgi:hypothetical protein